MNPKAIRRRWHGWCIPVNPSKVCARPGWPRIAPQAALTLLADWKSSGRITAAQYDAVTRPADPTAKDTIRPTIRIVSPAQGTSVSNDTGFIVVEAIVTDASGIAQVEIEGTRLYQSPWRARVDLAV
ncbi:MAG: hypothetical protein IPN62_17645, partial [Flavobacteriales bacterium]|nr:hypothetical protein [Flavobacteriales bacterium]